jgi:hypothetical protein
MESPISPKVIVSVIVGIVLTAVVSNISAITPDMLNFLGPWKLFVFGVLITAVTGLAGWWKTDPLRVTPKADAITVPESQALTALAAKVFPAAKVDAALAAVPVIEPVTVTPIIPATPAP